MPEKSTSNPNMSSAGFQHDHANNPVTNDPTWPVGRGGPTYEHNADPAIWKRRALALKRVAPRIPRTHCLARALALRWWMRSAGLDARMKIGIRKGPDGLESHAWVELDGMPIDETQENVASYKIIPHDQLPAKHWRR
jgi:hypothetical protein